MAGRGRGMAGAALLVLLTAGEVGRGSCTFSRTSAPRLQLRHGLSQYDVSSNETLRDVMQLSGDKRVRVGKGCYMWDWRCMDPWLRRRRDQVREFCMEPRAGGQVHVRGDGAVLDGQWDFHPSCSGSMEDLVLQYRTLVMDTRELLLLNGGSWQVSMCELKASGMQVLRCQRDTVVDISRSFVGGITCNPYEREASEDCLRASNGLVAIEKTRVSLHSCEVSFTGLLDGSALKAMGASTVKACNCTFMQNVVSVYVSQNCSVLVEDSTFLHKRFSHLLVGPPAPSNAKLRFFRNRGVGSLWGLSERPKVFEEEGNTFLERENKSDLELLRENFAYLPLYHERGIGEKQDWLLAREGGYLVETGKHIVYCMTCGEDNNLKEYLTCQHCFDPRQQFQRKYGLGEMFNASALFEFLEEESRRQHRSFRVDREIEQARELAATTRQWPWTKPTRVEEKVENNPISDFLHSTQRLLAIEGLKSNYTEAYNDKEELKEAYRSKRDESVRMLLVQAQERYARARAALVKALEQVSKAEDR